MFLNLGSKVVSRQIGVSSPPIRLWRKHVWMERERTQNTRYLEPGSVCLYTFTVTRIPWPVFSFLTKHYYSLMVCMVYGLPSHVSKHFSPCILSSTDFIQIIYTMFSIIDNNFRIYVQQTIASRARVFIIIDKFPQYLLAIGSRLFTCRTLSGGSLIQYIHTYHRQQVPVC